MAYLVAGKGVEVDWIVQALLTCKYMGWDLNTYLAQPLEFIQAINLFRRVEAEEVNRNNKHNG